MIDDDSPAMPEQSQQTDTGEPEQDRSPAEEPKPKPNRRTTTRPPRRTKRVSAAGDDTTAPTEADPSALTAPDSAGGASPGPEVADAASTPAPVVLATVAEEVPSSTPEAVGADTSEPAAKPRARRAPKRKKAAAAEEPELPVAAQIEAPRTEVVDAEPASLTLASEPEPVPAPVEAEPSASEPAEAQPAAPPARKRRSRGGRRRGGRGSAEAPAAEETAKLAEAPEEAPAVAVEPEPEATPTAEAPPAAARRSRRATRRPPAEDEPVVGARIAVRRGLPEIVVNGKTLPPALFFGNLDGAKEARIVAEEVARAARAGVHVHSTLVELVCPIPPDDTVYEQVDERLRALLDADPDAYLIPRLVFVPAPGWRQQYPNEVTRYADGTSDDPSIASDVFWSEAEVALRALIAHINRTTYAERVIGFHLERGEWFHPASAGYDRSFANREAFRQWLRARYRNSEVALRAGWYDGTVQFYTAEIPDPERKPRAELAFFEPRKERRWIDFLEYTSEAVADRLISLARTVKDATSNRCLVSVCYGYTFEFGHVCSGHLALSRLLTSSSIDIIAGPPSYRDRQPGGAGTIPSPVDACAVHGKLWLSEDDTKTYLSPQGGGDDDFNPRVGTRDATEHVHRRAVGQALAHQSGIGWMDLWGEGWLNSDDVWQLPSRFTEVSMASAKTRRSITPKVVALVDERSLMHVQRGDAFVRRVLRDQREALLRSGASVGFYLQSDVLARGFPVDAKLYVFLTPYCVPADQRVAIREKLHSGGKTLAWLYAVGVCDDRAATEDGASDPVGITLRQQAWSAEIGSRFMESRHPLAEGLANRHIGTRERVNPSFYIADEDGVTVIGEYQQTGLPSIGVREFPRWRSVFCGEPALTTEFFRNLCRYAGVHLYTAGSDDYVYAGHGWLTLHAIGDGSRSLRVPTGMDLYDVTGREPIAEGTSDYRFSMRAHTSRVFFVGQRDEMARLGLAAGPAARGRRRAGRTAIDVDVAPVEADDAAVAAAEGDVIDTDGLHGMVRESIADAVADTAEMQEISETAESTAKRRRRRRGGRGRGKRRGAEPASGDGTAPGTPEGAD